MSFRSPSLLVNQTPNTMRRRSGGNPNHEPGSRSHTYTVPQFQSNDNDLMSQIEDTGELHSQTTVLLVRPSQQSPPLPSLPAFAPDVSFIPPIPTNHLDADIYTSKQDPCQDHATAPFSTIPLTPRPDAPSRTTSEFSLQSTQTLASQISRLPTPDFTDPKHKPDFSLHSYLPRRFSFRVFRRLPVSYESSSASLVSPGRPESVRSESDGSFRSRWSSASSSSIDTGHHSLIPSIGTTVKFTHKWPKPQPLRNLEVRGGSQKRSDTGLGQATILALEQGQGLGMDKIERWTSYKWCLLLSVSTVFAYGATGLVYAILTWFRSEFPVLNLTLRSRSLTLLSSLESCGCHVRCGRRYPHPHHPCVLDSSVHGSRRNDRGTPEFKTHSRHLHPSAMASLDIPPRCRIHQLQASHVLLGPQAQPLLEPILYPTRSTPSSGFSPVLRFLQRSA